MQGDRENQEQPGAGYGREQYRGSGHDQAQAGGTGGRGGEGGMGGSGTPGGREGGWTPERQPGTTPASGAPQAPPPTGRTPFPPGGRKAGGRQVSGGYGTGAPPGARVPPPGRPPRRGPGFGMVIMALVAAVVGALLVLTVMPWAFGVSPWDLIRGELRKIETQEGKETVKVISPTEGATSIANIAQDVTPAIVNIDIRTAPRSTFLFELAPEEGTGSGVIYRKDGYIITNSHVIQDAQEISVTLASGEELTGTRVGADTDNDIAVIKVDKSNLPTLDLGDSDNLKVGELAIAVGSPFGYEHSVTAGIISALHRYVTAQAADQTTLVLTDLIQTDAAINPGNSGGALCDSEARLIGINTIIATAAGGSEGVGFSIPINTAKEVADDIIAGRPVSHPYIGVLGQSVTKPIAEEYGLPVDEGAYITRVIQDGPAGKAGIEEGDIVVAVDGERVESMDELIAEIRKRDVGETINVDYFEDSSRKTTEITLEEKPSQLP